MSTLARDIDAIREAAAIAKKLSPAMLKAMTATTDGLVPRRVYVVANEVEPGSLTLHGANTNTAVALLTRGLLSLGRTNEAGNVVHDFTDLGLLVRDVLVRGAEVLLEEARASYWAKLSIDELNEHLSSAINRWKTGQASHFYLDEIRRRVMDQLHAYALAEYAEVTRTTQKHSEDAENLTHDALVIGIKIRCVQNDETAQIESLANGVRQGVGAVNIQITSGSDAGRIVSMTPAEIVTYWRKIADRDEGQGPKIADWPQASLLSVERTITRHTVLAQVADRQYREVSLAGPQRSDGLMSDVERVAFARLLEAGWIERHKTVILPGVSFRLTDFGARALMVWDGAYARNDLSETLAAGVPPREIIVSMPTTAIVQKYPHYYITGPGRIFAQQVSCEHGYRLTDSCPCC